jgi:hypothetical protein
MAETIGLLADLPAAMKNRIVSQFQRITGGVTGFSAWFDGRLALLSEVVDVDKVNLERFRTRRNDVIIDIDDIRFVSQIP